MERIDKVMGKLLEEERISKGDIQIWGGKIKEEELQEFMKKWNFSDMQFRIKETVKEINIDKNKNLDLQDVELIERIRIFGNAGDIDLRRNGNRFIWRYIGEDSPPSNLPGHVCNFWGKDKNSNKKFFVGYREVILWNKNDPRVAKAKLNYPIKNAERVKIRYKTLSEGGIISFVQFIEIKNG
ncbi:MAG: hypothetical protein A7315_04630 [Candidatus Altiarchaeales archaeon WOR_SM1_79]|nr:MAG: hypothetical protein A7315_04630 [Candidatus Altiarchaeales archaeon WOR_SM1_79]